MLELPKKALLRPDEVAAYLDVSVKTIYLWIDHGLLSAEKYRRCIRIPRQSVVDFRKKGLLNVEDRYAI